MSTDYTVSSLPTLAFNAPAPLSWEKFCEIAGLQATQPELQAAQPELQAAQPELQAAQPELQAAQPELQAFTAWSDLETQLRNAVAEARGGERFKRPTTGCSLYWKNRVLACFQEKDVAKRDELLDRVWWDAAGELTPPSEPLGKGALATYAIRLKIALKRSKISKDAGNASFDRLTAETKR